MEELSRIHVGMIKCYKDNSFPIDMTEEDEKKFKTATHSHIYEKTCFGNRLQTILSEIMITLENAAIFVVQHATSVI